jgi:hypothetical protein
VAPAVARGAADDEFSEAVDWLNRTLDGRG